VIKRPLSGAVVLVLCVTFGTVVATNAERTPALAAGSASAEADFLARINDARAADGLPRYAVSSDLTGVARSHSQEMARRQRLYHNPSLTTDVHDWQAVGENVGEGPTVADIHQAFMNSSPHRSNILDHDFTEAGIGVSVDGNGTIWVTEDFRQPMPTAASTRSPPTTAVPTPTAAPATVHDPGPPPQAVLRRRVRSLRHRHWAKAADGVGLALRYIDVMNVLVVGRDD
jgi:hypothetical protein